MVFCEGVAVNLSNRSDEDNGVELMADEEYCESDSSDDVLMVERGGASGEESEEDEDDDEGVQFLQLPTLRLLAQLLGRRSRAK